MEFAESFTSRCKNIAIFEVAEGIRELASLKISCFYARVERERESDKEYFFNTEKRFYSNFMILITLILSASSFLI